MMGPISIGFSTAPGAVSWIIRKLTSSRVSHVFLLFQDPMFNLEVVLEASEGGFHVVPYARRKASSTIVTIVPVRCDLTEGMRYIAALLGTHYDYAGLFGTAVVLAGRWFRRRWHNPFHSKRAMFCSESVVRVLIASGYPGADSLDPEDTTPQDLLDFLQADKFQA